MSNWYDKAMKKAKENKTNNSAVQPQKKETGSNDWYERAKAKAAEKKPEQMPKTEVVADRLKVEKQDRDDSKLGAFFKGTAKQYGGGHASAGATMLQNETAREGFNAMGDHTQQPAKFLSDLIVNKIKGDNFTQKVEEKQNRELNAYGKDAVKRADQMIQSGTKDLEYVKEDMNGLSKFGVDAGSQLLMMGADAMLSFIPGVGPALSQASLASRAGGLGASEARAEGAGEAEQLVYGAASGLLELGLEKIFSAGKLMKNMYGKGALNLADATASKAATSNLLKGITKTAKGQELVYNLTKLGVASTEEGIEEALSAVLTPFLQRAIYSDELEMASIEDILYDFAVGAVSGGVFGGAGTAADYRAGVGTAEQIKQNPDFIDMVLNKGMAQNEGTEANAFAQNLQSQQAAGKNILGSQLNELNRMNKSEQLKNDDVLARTVAEETSDISRIKKNVSETEKRAIQRISDKKAEDISIDLSKKVAQNANLSLGFSAENVEIPAISRVMLGTATSADIDVILANPQAKSLLEEEAGTTIPMENSKAREMIGTMVAMNARVNGEQILKESKAIIAEDLANTGGTLGAKGKQMFVSAYPQVAEADSEKFTTIFKRFYDGGTYSIPYEKITELVSGMGEDYAAVADKYFTPEMRMSLYEAGNSDSKAQTEANERSIVKREKVADRQRKGAFEDQSTVGNLSKPMKTALEKLADRAGVNIVYVDTLGNANGSYETGRNGAYLNSTIMLAADSANPLLAVAKHELTHHIKTTAPKQYKELEDFVFSEWYKGDPKAYEEAIQKKIETYKEAGITLTRDGAKEEILADASERFFTDESAIDRAIAYSKALGEAILDGIKTVLDSFTAIMNEEGLSLKGYGDFMEQLGIVEEAERMWMKALEASMTSDVKGKATEKKYSLNDDEYLTAVKNGDMAKAQQMVDEAAKMAGYNSPKLYHGTRQFGFTEPRTTGVEDGAEWSPFFATDGIHTAQTYSRTNRVRKISETNDFDYDSMIEEEENIWRDAIIEFADAASQFVGIRGWLDVSTVETEIGGIFGDVVDGYTDIAKASEEIWDYVFNIEHEVFGAMYDEAADGLDGEEKDEALDTLQEEIQDKLYQYAEHLYSVIDAVSKAESDSRGNYQLYAKTDDLFVIDAKGARWNGIDFEADGYYAFDGRPRKKWKTRDIASYAKDKGYSGTLVKNLIDDGGQGVYPQYAPSDVYIFFNPQEQVKSADPVTYDDNGNIIPLSQRFNPDSQDIRYSLKDTEDRTLAAGQQEYFKNSKVRDAEGRLKVMYHGTPAGDFTVFKDGSYFTDNPEYADRYQSPSASSISYGKEATAPKTFEVYLNIKKPFDIRDPEARRVYIEDYIKGGNAMGIDPYLSDAEYNKIQTIDWTEGEDLRDFLIEEGYDYDGLILDEGADGGYGDEVQYRGESYVVFSPEQVKNVDNENPTDSPDIRFSLKEPVEETRDLIAVHNMQASELEKTLDLGGFPMPSIAIIKAKAGHNEYGDVSVVFDKDTIDPELMKANKVYGGDAWTPEFPSVSYKADEKVAKNIAATINKHYNELPYYFQREVYSFSDYDNIDDKLNREGGAEKLKERYADNYGFKQLYLAEKGEIVPVAMKEERTELTDVQKEDAQAIIDAVGEEELLAFTPEGLASYKEVRLEWLKKNKPAIVEAYSRNYANEKMSVEEAREIFAAESNLYWTREVRQAIEYLKTGGVTIEQVEDLATTKDIIDKKIDNAEYRKWFNALFKGLEGKSGIRNNKDMFTPSGNRRSWDALHDPITLDNVLKAMRGEESQKGAGAFGGSMMGASTREFTSVEDIKRASDNLRIVPDEEIEAAKKYVNDTLFEIADVYAVGKSVWDAKDALIEAVASNETKSGIKRYLKQYDYVYRLSDDIVDDLIELRDYVRTLPTGYFEAKPRRAVGLDEIKAIIVPTDIDTELLNRLTTEGYNVVQYEAGNSEDRVEKLNSLENLRFQLKDSEPTEAKKVQTLEERVAYLKSEMKTNLKTPEEKETKSQAAKLLKQYNSSIVLHTELVNTMKDIFKIYKTSNDWDVAYQKAEKMARRIVDKIEILHDESWQEYKDLRKYLKETPITISEADKASMSNYADFRKTNFGRLNLTNGEKSTVSDFYSKLVKKWPEKFTTDYTNTAEQLHHIEDVLDSLAPWYEHYSSRQMQSFVTDIAEDIMLTTAELTTRKTFADRKAEEKDAAVKRVIEQRDAMLARQRERYEKKLVRQKELGKMKLEDFKEKQKDRQNRSKAMARLEKSYKWLKERLLTPSDTKHIPEGYQKAIATLLEGFDFETARTDAYGAKNGLSKRVIELRKFKDMCREIMESSDADQIEFDPDFMANLDEITDAIDGKRLADLDTATLDKVSRLLKQLQHQISYMNRAFNEEISETISELGENTINEADSMKRAKEYTGFKQKLDDLLNQKNVTPSDMFELIGGTEKKLYATMRKGFDRHVQNVQQGVNFVQSIADKKKVKQWENDLHTFRLESGEIQLTTTQLMSLYALMQREQAQNHILGSGIMSEPVEVKGDKARMKRKISQEHVMPTLEEVLQMTASLTEEQRNVADKLKDFLSNQCSDWGNETSMKLYGYKKFTEKNYFPIKSSKQFLNENFDLKNAETSLKNMGFTKSLTPGANNPIMIDDIFNVFSQHVSKMSMYNALVPAMTDFQRVYNYKRKNEAKLQTNSVQLALEKAYGKKTTEYITRFMQDLNGAPGAKSDADLATELVGRYKKASLGANIRVFLQQPTAIVRAFAVISPKYFSVKPAGKVTIEEMQAHCPVAQWKSYGFYNTDVARGMKDIMLGNETIMDKLFMGSYGKADDWAWAQIWKAVKAEVEAKNPNLVKGSDEYWQKVNERASEIFDRTQVVDSVFHRSQIMRNKGLFEKTITSFMAEPTKTFNLMRTEIITAQREAASGNKAAAGKRLGRVLGVYALNGIAVSVAAAFADAMRGIGGDDDEDKGTFAQRWFAHSRKNFWANINPLNLLPYTKDIVSMYNGYEVTRLDTQGFDKLVNTVTMWQKVIDGSSKYTTAHVTRKTAEAISYVTGVPLANILRDVESAGKAVSEAFGNGTAAKFQTAKMTYRVTENTRYIFADLYYDAKVEKDNKLANEIYRWMKSQGITDEYIKGREKTWKKHRGEEN